MKKEFYKVILDFSAGSAYQYRIGSEIPTKIEYCRKYAGKYEKGKIEGIFSNIKLHDIMFLIKRGCELSEIKERIKMIY